VSGSGIREVSNRSFEWGEWRKPQPFQAVQLTLVLTENLIRAGLGEGMG
jgi:hypothetical protein